MKSVSERACCKTWTGELQTEGGRLPDLKDWVRAFREEIGQAFVIRGVEATVEGRLFEEDGKLALRLERTGEVLRLVPLRRNVAWDPKRDREAPLTDDERKAHERLAESRGRAGVVRVVGPLVQDKDGVVSALEVREFTWPAPRRNK